MVLPRPRRAAGAAARAKGARTLEEVASWRAVLGALVDDPDAALATLRGVPAPNRRRSTQRPPGVEPELDATIRVSAQSVDALLDYSAGIAAARERVAARGHGAMEHARTMRRLRADLVEALRLIGPPRPWGAPAAALRRVESAAATLGKLSEEVEGVSGLLHSLGQSLRDDVGASRKILSAMRQMPIRGLFNRLASAVAAEAKRIGRAISVQTVGADELVDRRLVAALAEPCLQLARNAIAHGIEPPEARAALGKPRAATLTLSAGRIGNRLFIAIADDGAGVDVSAVRARAVESGVVTEVLAEAADDQTLLELLFLPGFSTRGHSPDLIAGRGIGLDITLASVQRLGGAIHLSSRRGEGFEARVDVPIESGLVNGPLDRRSSNRARDPRLERAPHSDDGGVWDPAPCRLPRANVDDARCAGARPRRRREHRPDRHRRGRSHRGSPRSPALTAARGARTVRGRSRTWGRLDPPRARRPRARTTCARFGPSWAAIRLSLCHFRGTDFVKPR